jgi:26S proteasome regulatory subunit N5
MEQQDFSSAVDAVLPATDKLAASGKLNEAIEQLLALEKQTRTGGDAISNGRVLVQIASLCFKQKDFKQLNEHIIVLSKKHGFLKLVRGFPSSFIFIL